MEKKVKILLVEDDVATRKLERMILERNKYSVKEAPEAETALGMLESEVVDILIVDILMPGMSGLELLAKVRENPLTQNVPVILCSASADQEKVKEALSLGISGYILKPIVAKDFIQKVVKSETQILPILKDPSGTIYRLGLKSNEFRDLIQIMIDDGKKKLKNIGRQIEVGDLEDFNQFCHDIASSANNFGAMALQNAAEEASAMMHKCEGEFSGKYMFNLRTQMERLKEASFTIS